MLSLAPRKRHTRAARSSAETALPLFPSTHAAFAGTGLSCRRGEKRVFARLDFSLKPGGALVLVGPNGSGKSSLLRVLAGLTPPELGILSWNGVNIAEDRSAHHQRLHFIGHSDALKPVLSVAEMVGFWAGMRGSQTEIGAALGQFGLEAVADLPCRYLSAGQKRRLALTRLVASPAPLWLLDEPLTSLDTEAAGRLLTAIAAHRAEGGSVVLSTHAPIELADATRLSLADFRPARLEIDA
jgi:heme exporter protein A